MSEFDNWLFGTEETPDGNGNHPQQPGNPAPQQPAPVASAPQQPAPVVESGNPDGGTVVDELDGADEPAPAGEADPGAGSGA